MSSDTIRELRGLEYQLKTAKEQIAFGKRLEKLTEDKQFREVIFEDYCTQAAARFVAQSGDPILTTEQKADALAMAQAPGHLKRWLYTQIELAHQAEDRLVEIQENIVELQAEADAEE